MFEQECASILRASTRNKTHCNLCFLFNLRFGCGRLRKLANEVVQTKARIQAAAAYCSYQRSCCTFAARTRFWMLFLGQCLVGILSADFYNNPFSFILAHGLQKFLSQELVATTSHVHMAYHTSASCRPLAAANQTMCHKACNKPRTHWSMAPNGPIPRCNTVAAAYAPVQAPSRAV